MKFLPQYVSPVFSNTILLFSFCFCFVWKTTLVFLYYNIYYSFLYWFHSVVSSVWSWLVFPVLASLDWLFYNQRIRLSLMCCEHYYLCHETCIGYIITRWFYLLRNSQWHYCFYWYFFFTVLFLNLWFDNTRAFIFGECRFSMHNYSSIKYQGQLLFYWYLVTALFYSFDLRIPGHSFLYNVALVGINFPQKY